jgi:hypothetical protein
MLWRQNVILQLMFFHFLQFWAGAPQALRATPPLP